MVDQTFKQNRKINIVCVCVCVCVYKPLNEEIHMKMEI